MDLQFLHNLSLGFGVAVEWWNLFFCLAGVMLGTLIGVLPGIGPTATIAMLLPVTFSLSPVAALIMLAGIYYGAQYGGSTTAILVNLPGEPASVVTCLDGYQMARQGRAGPALACAAIGSFFAGCTATVAVAMFAPPLAEVALKFGPPEYFSLMVLGLVAAVVLARGSLLKAITMVLLGLLLGLVGADVNSGVLRFTFGIPELADDGISFIVVAMGVYGITEIVTNLELKEHREVFTSKVGRLMPSKEDFRRMWKPILRGTVLGAALGILPGGGPLLASFGAYTLEKKVSKYGHEFGQGAIEGVAGPESANNAGAQTSFIPMLTLGIPSNAVMALMLGAMMIQGIAPGPLVMTQKPELFWGLITSMWIGNAMLLILNLPLIGIWIKMLAVPYRLLYPSILLFMGFGVYSLSNSPFDVLLMAIFGILGYVFAKLECEPAPLILGLILGPMMEENLRRAMLVSRGDPMVFFTHPISAGFLTSANTYVGDEFTGKTVLPNIAPGESANPSFGIDDRMKIQHQRVRLFTSHTGLFGNRTRVDFEFKTTIENYHTKPVTMTLVEQIPISAHKDITVSLTKLDPRGAVENKDNGTYTYAVEMEPQEKVVVNIGYAVEYPTQTRIAGLYDKLSPARANELQNKYEMMKK